MLYLTLQIKHIWGLIIIEKTMQVQKELSQRPASISISYFLNLWSSSIAEANLSRRLQFHLMASLDIWT